MSAAASVRRLAATVLSLCLAWIAFAAHAAIGLERDGGPFVPTPPRVVDAMLALAAVGASDFVVDLGSGDGRVVLAAARAHAARGLGVELDEELVAEASRAAKQAGVAGRTRFAAGNMLEADVRDATVVTLYVLPAMMARLRPKLLAELAPGARIVSHDFIFDEWEPDARTVVDAPEKRPYHSEGVARLYLWVVPARLAGRWSGTAGDAAITLDLEQNAKSVRGTAQWRGESRPLADVVVAGTSVSFTLEHGGARHAFAGRAAGDVIEGEVRAPGRGAALPWRIRRGSGR